MSLNEDIAATSRLHDLARSAIRMREDITVELCDPRWKEPRREEASRKILEAEAALNEAVRHLNSAKELEIEFDRKARKTSQG